MALDISDGASIDAGICMRHLDGSGLAVTSLSQLQPDDMLMRTFSAQMPPGTSVSVTSEPSDVKMHLSDGREVAARIVLRDADLDLAFLKPSEPLAAPIPAVDGPSGKLAGDTITGEVESPGRDGGAPTKREWVAKRAN